MSQGSFGEPEERRRWYLWGLGLAEEAQCLWKPPLYNSISGLHSALGFSTPAALYTVQKRFEMVPSLPMNN